MFSGTKLINGDIFLLMLRNFRSLWLDGRPGGGKTLLSFYLAKRLVDAGHARYICANVPSVWSDGIDKILDNVRGGMYLDTVFILDEGGLFVENSKQARKFTAFLRKYNTYVILPSTESPASKLTRFSLYRKINWAMFGVPMWQYQATLKVGQSSGHASKHKMNFWLTNPASMYGIYDTQAAPTDAFELIDMMNTHDSNVARLQGRNGTSLSVLSSGWDEASYMIEVAERHEAAMAAMGED